MLKQIYGPNNKNEQVADYDDESTVKLAEQLTSGVPIATPVFDGAREPDIVELLNEADLDPSGQSTLYDGRTGEPFDRKVTVGYIYMLKLHHLVDDKIHARSIGPYCSSPSSRWAARRSSAASASAKWRCGRWKPTAPPTRSQEMLTVKSDDVAGRTKVYEAIVRGDDTFEAGIPESFNVLVKEMRSLGLDVELDNSKDAPGGGAGAPTWTPRSRPRKWPAACRQQQTFVSGRPSRGSSRPRGR